MTPLDPVGGARERPILFSGAMVRALLEGRKTQTRRLLAEQPLDVIVGRAPWAHYATRVLNGRRCWAAKFEDNPPRGKMICCRSGEVGDRLWVREAWQFADWTEDGYPFVGYRADESRRCIETAGPEWSDRLTDTWAKLSEPANYDIDNRAADRRWRPGIHMPRWASRITLEVTEVRVQRLQDISEEDADAEGIDSLHGEMNDARLCALAKSMGVTADDSRAWFAELWESINGKRAPWSSNPWVWAVTFRLVSPASAGEGPVRPVDEGKEPVSSDPIPGPPRADVGVSGNTKGPA